MYSESILKVINIALALFSFTFIGCGNDRPSKSCPLQVLSYGIVLHLEDVSTSTEICSASVLVTGSNYSEKVTEAQDGGGNCAFLLAKERAGKYSVKIDAPGYQVASTTVTVDRLDECEVKTERITLPLSK